MTEATGNVFESLVDASKLTKNRKEFYAIGRVAGRISFGSQQTRALNLVLALFRTGKLQVNNKVAVVGGGIAGVTTAAALLAHGCTVVVLERSAEVVLDQRNATHRRVHPTLNWWPQGHAELVHTADMPFLEWYFAKCNDVATHICKQFERMQSVYGNDLLIRRGWCAKELNVREIDDTFIVKSEHGDQIENLDTIIVTTGFDSENHHPSIPSRSYWLPEETHAKTLDGTKARVVSGFGDGGQIDALRMLYDFDEGKLAVQLAESIDAHEEGARIRKLILEAEDDLDTAERRYKAAAKILEGLPEFANKDKGLLKSNFQTMSVGSVLMVDEALENPFASLAAPIHKLMIAYAAGHSVVEYEQSKITMLSDNEFTAADKTFSTTDTHIVIRHGASQSVPDFVDEQQWNDLTVTNRVLREQNFKPLWDNDSPYPVPRHFACSVKDKQDYLNRTFPNLQKLFANIGVTGLVTPGSQNYLVLADKDAKIPNKAFGIEIEKVPFGDAKTFEGAGA